MFSPSPLHPVFICHEPVNFRLGIDGLIGFCKQVLATDPMSGACFVFRNKRADALRLLFYVNDGWWLCTKRFSEGKIRHWPGAINQNLMTEGGQKTKSLSTLAARELAVLLWKGNVEGAQFPPFWKKLPQQPPT